MIGRILTRIARPVVAVVARGPVADRIARRLMAAPRTSAEEEGLRQGVEALGGEVVRLRARDGVRLVGRWLPAEPGADGAWLPDPREAVLLLHGYTGSVVPDLVELGPFLRRTANLLGLDFRGHGASDDGPTTFGALEVEDVAGALAWLGERGIRRVALVGSSMGGIVALASLAVLGDGRLAAADADPDAPAGVEAPPRPRIVAVVADSVPPELSVVVASRVRAPFARLVAERAFATMARRVGADPRATEPVRAVALAEDVPLLLIHGDADRTVPIRDGRRLVAAAPAEARHVVIPGADHGRGHATDPARYEAAVEELLRPAFAAARS